MTKEYITYEEFEQKNVDVWEDFLRHATVNEIFQSAVSSNWDGNSFLINKLVNDPKTDKATILAIYWMSCPDQFKRFKSREHFAEERNWDLDDYDLMEEIEKKYTGGFFSQSSISFDPACDVDGDNWTKSYLKNPPVREISQEMLNPLEGEVVGLPSGWTEGLPSEYWERISEIYDKYDYYCSCGACPVCKKPGEETKS